MNDKPTNLHFYKYILIGLTSCSLLAYEILLIRVCALRLAFHFGFLIISNCLLAIGASGSLISLKQNAFEKKPRFWLTLFSLMFLLSLIVVYIFLSTYPVASSVSGHLFLSKPKDLFHLFIFNLVASIPFFFGGTVVGMLLTFNPARVNRLYFVDLVGAALGCLISPLVLSPFGAGGCMVVIWLLALIGVAIAAADRRKNIVYASTILLFLVGVVLVPKLDRLLPVKGRYFLDISNALQIEQSPNTMGYTQWTATSRIDMVFMQQRPNRIFGMGTKKAGLPPLPQECAIVQDASAGTEMVNFSEDPKTLEIIRSSTYSASVRLKKNPRVFIIGVGGANDVWAAHAANARYVKAVELNAPIIDIHKKVFPEFSKALTANPNIHFVVDEGRSALMRDNNTYDVIQLTGVDTWTGLKSGAYILAENYLYTIEAIQNMYAHLSEEGILQYTRMAENMEILRMVSNLYAAYPKNAKSIFENSIVIMNTPDLMATFMVKPSGFSKEELRSIAMFQQKNGITPVYTPGTGAGNSVEGYIRTKNKAEYIENFPRDISPTRDDRPYFFHFSRWNKPLDSRKYMDELSSVSQGNPFFLLIQLIVSTVLSVTFILLPLLGKKAINRRFLLRSLCYFSGVGLGFIMLEVSMIQKLTVFLGHPIYSITVTLASMLFFAGCGSLVSAKWFNSSHRKSWAIPTGLFILAFVFLTFWPYGQPLLIKLPLAMRILIAILIIAPFGFFLGVPFAYGLRLLHRHNPTLIPWAWAVNGCFSVIGSILTVILSIAFGFIYVFSIAVGVYLFAFSALIGIGSAESS